MNSTAQGSCTTFLAKPSSWSKGVKLKQHVTTLHMVGRTDRCFLVRRNLRLSVGAFFHGSKVKLLKISAFKGSAQNDESGGRGSGSKVSKNSVKLSYIPEESEETMIESPKVHSIPVSYPPGENVEITDSPAFHKLFKKWLNVLRTQTPNHVVNERLGEGLSPKEELPQTQNTTQNMETGQTLKVVWDIFLGLDATMKIPLLMFIPLYLAVNVIYGVEVSKELTPLWIFGPLITALYIKLLRGLWALYVFSIKQTVNVIKNLPTYYILAHNYIAQGKLQLIENLDYKEFSRNKKKQLEECFVEKYLDFVESIWPLYCRTIRFLKKANLI